MDSDNRSAPAHQPTYPPKPVHISTDSDKEQTLPPLTRIPNCPSELPPPMLSPPPPPPPPPPQPQSTTELSSSSSPPLSPGSAAEEAVQSGVGIQVPLEDRVKGPWSPEEDAILSRLVMKFGARNWSTIARGIPGRSGKSSENLSLGMGLDFAKKDRGWAMAMAMGEEEDTTCHGRRRRRGEEWRVF